MVSQDFIKLPATIDQSILMGNSPQALEELALISQFGIDMSSESSNIIQALLIQKRPPHVIAKPLIRLIGAAHNAETFLPMRIANRWMDDMLQMMNTRDPKGVEVVNFVLQALTNPQAQLAVAGNELSGYEEDTTALVVPYDAVNDLGLAFAGLDFNDPITFASQINHRITLWEDKLHQANAGLISEEESLEIRQAMGKLLAYANNAISLAFLAWIDRWKFGGDNYQVRGLSPQEAMDAFIPILYRLRDYADENVVAAAENLMATAAVPELPAEGYVGEERLLNIFKQFERHLGQRRVTNEYMTADPVDSAVGEIFARMHKQLFGSQQFDQALINFQVDELNTFFAESNALSNLLRFEWLARSLKTESAVFDENYDYRLLTILFAYMHVVIQNLFQRNFDVAALSQMPVMQTFVQFVRELAAADYPILKVFDMYFLRWGIPFADDPEIWAQDSDVINQIMVRLRTLRKEDFANRASFRPTASDMFLLNKLMNRNLQNKR